MTKKKEVVEAPMGYMLGTDIPRKCKKVSIVGFATSMEDVRHVWDDPDMEVWGLNQLHAAFPAIVEHATRWFQIHPKRSYDINVTRDATHHQWLQKQMGFPIYMQNVSPDIPKSVRFPVDIILSNFRRYFTNSISWEIAVAINEAAAYRAKDGTPGFTDIYIFGVDMAQDSEWAYERPSVEYFIGIAEGLGIKVHVPESCDLLKSVFLYPFEESAPFKHKSTVRRGQLRGRLNECAMQEQNMRDERMQLIGALDNMNYIERSWMATARPEIEGPMPEPKEK